MTVAQVLDELGGVSRRTFYRWREIGHAPRASGSQRRDSASTAASSPPGLRPSGRRREHLVRREVLGDPPEQVSKTASYEVRWKVGGRQKSRTFGTKALAENFLSELRQAAKRARRSTWRPAFPVDDSRPRTRATWSRLRRGVHRALVAARGGQDPDSMTDALATALPCLMKDLPGGLTMRSLRRRCASTSSSRRTSGPIARRRSRAAVRWLEAASLPPDRPGEAKTRRAALDAWRCGSTARRRRPTTVRRKRAVFHHVLEYAVELEELRQIRCTDQVEAAARRPRRVDRRVGGQPAPGPGAADRGDLRGQARRAWHGG